MGDPNGGRQRSALIRDFDDEGREHLFLSAFIFVELTSCLNAAQATSWAVTGANHGGACLGCKGRRRRRRRESRRRRQLEPAADTSEACSESTRRAALALFHPVDLKSSSQALPPRLRWIRLYSYVATAGCSDRIDSISINIAEYQIKRSSGLRATLSPTMSLVNLSHVCSHLQNASLAKLGLTSIPYTQMHLSLSLLLQKQGFLSQVKLGGPSPPASCFPPGSLRKPLRIDNGQDERISKKHPEMSEHMWKSREQLTKDGWDSIAANFLMKYEGRTSADLTGKDGLSEKDLEIIEAHAPILAAARTDVRKWMPAPEPENPEGTPQQRQRSQRARANLENTRLKSQLLRDGFAVETLQHFAGPNNSRRTVRDLDRDGITISAMGVDIHNQRWEVPKSRDTEQLDDEGVVTQANRSTRRLWLGLKYWNGVPVLKKARMLSKPTKRIWLNSRELGGLVRGKGAFKEQIKPLTLVGEIMVVSTDRGLMEVRDCVERRIGGMPLCRIW